MSEFGSSLKTLENAWLLAIPIWQRGTWQCPGGKVGRIAVELEIITLICIGESEHCFRSNDFQNRCVELRRMLLTLLSLMLSLTKMIKST